jgi:uncharacterized membrane protein
MTVREWVERRTPCAPSTLLARVLSALGSDAARDASEVAETCLTAAARELNALLAAGRFARDSAIDLLAIDALTTYAFENASESARDERDLLEFSERGAASLGRLMEQRV